MQPFRSHSISSLRKSQLTIGGALYRWREQQQQQQQEEEVTARDDNNIMEDDDSYDDMLLESLPSSNFESLSSGNKSNNFEPPKVVAENLVAYDDDSTPNENQEQQKKKSQSVADEILDAAAEDAIELIRMFQRIDPFQKLEEYYLKKGFDGDIRPYFRDVFHRTQKHANRYWRCIFTCPINGGEIATQLPLALMCGDRPTDDLAELVHRYFGPYMIMDDLVYFGSKRGARRSVCVAAWMSLQEENDNSFNTHGSSTSFSDRVVLVESKEEASLCLLQSLDQVTIPTPKPFQKKQRRHHPSWVHELFDAGIVDGVNISYREQLDQNNTEWKGQPAMYRCQISISTPQTLAVVGMPHSSKHNARQSAVDILLKELNLQQQNRPEQAHHCTTLDQRNDKKNGIAKADAQKGCYVYPLPSWACAPLSTNDPDKSKAYLYELVITTQTGEPVTHNKFSLSDQEATRLGVLFARDIGPERGQGMNPSSLQYATPFCLKKLQKGTPKEEFIVAVRHRTVVNLNKLGNSDETTKDGLAWIQTFNRSIDRWKMYGIRNVSEVSNEPSPSDGNSRFGRTYLFVPLLAETDKTGTWIDWDTLRSINACTTTPFLAPPLYCLRLPYYELEARTASALLSLVLLFLVAPEIVTPTIFLSTSHDLHELSKAAIQWLLFLFLIAIAFVSMFHRPSRKMFSEDAMRNRFFFQSPCPSPIYTGSDNKNAHLGSNSLYRYTDARAGPAKERGARKKRKRRNKKKHDLDIAHAAFSEFNLQRCGLWITHRPEKLLASYLLKMGHNYYNPLESTLKSQANLYLIPERIRVMPMPRDALYVLGLAERFMPLLERTISVSQYSRIIEDMVAEFPRVLDHDEPDLAGILDRKHRRVRSLSSWLDEATTLHPRVTYQRLEFLGDAVLGFFIALNSFSRNSSLHWSFEDINEIHNAAGSNVALFGASLRMGLSRLLYNGAHPWQTASVIKRKKARRNSNSDAALELSQYGYCFDRAHVFKIADSHLSDAVESVLAALYLHDMGHVHEPTGGSIVLEFLERLDLPMPQHGGLEQWFPGKGQCLKGGYPFELDILWKQQVVEIGTVLYNEPEIFQRLQDGYASLLQKLAATSMLSSILDLLGQERAKILVLTALFDDNLVGPMERFVQAGALRDTLSHVGGYALRLQVTEEIFRINRNATAGDLHLLRECALADDVVVYIMMHAKLHECLFDRTSSCRGRVARFERIVREADRTGAAKWNSKRGWILGGVREFRNRCAQHFPGRGDWHSSRHPKYCGLAGGRLYGEKASRIPRLLTADLSFSFKSIVGALVLSLGTEGMWCCIRPLFEEVLLLSAGELRNEYKDICNLCRKSKSGKKEGGGSKKLRYGVFD